MIHYTFEINVDKIFIKLERQINETIFYYIDIIDNPGNLPEILNVQWLHDVKGDNYINRLEAQVNSQIY